MTRQSPKSETNANLAVIDDDLDTWLAHLERIHPKSIDLGLERSTEVARRLGLLPLPSKVLVVAGTNGKGTVAHASDALLQAQGFRTGRFTSPHILRFNERIAVDGVPVSDRLILDAFRAIETARSETTLTYFEFSTLAAIWVFAQAGVDVAILEVGLGGRLDAVNIADGDVSVITSISLDHQAWLGETVELIAPEKAAVARSGKPVVLAERAYPSTLHQTLEEIGARVLRAGREWDWQVENLAANGEAVQSMSSSASGNGAGFEGGAEGTPGRGFLRMNLAGGMQLEPLPMPAGLQPSNLAAAIQACALLVDSKSAMEARAGTARNATVLRTLKIPGRQQSLMVRDRALIFDVAHNVAAMQALADHLNTTPVVGQTFAVFAVMADKSLEELVETLASAVDGAFSMDLPFLERAAKPECVWQALDAAGIAIPQSDFTAEIVWEQLLARTSPGDRVVVCGSFHTVARIIPLVAFSDFSPSA
ncbi:MAG: folylpolyglutamate synthase/dihydrofolate synthase family protein [Pseudomonadota bacterium]